MTSSEAAASPRTERRRLPLGVWILVVIQVALALWTLAGLVGLRPLTESSGLGHVNASPEVVRVAISGLVVLQLLAALGLLLRLRIAWVTVMVLTGVALALGLVGVQQGWGNPVRLAIDVVAALYLNQGVVRRVFGVDRAGRQADLIFLEEDAR